MGCCFSGYTKSKDSDSSLGRKNSVGGKHRAKPIIGDLTTKASGKNSPSLTQKDHLSITSVESSNDISDVAKKSESARALPIPEKPESPHTEPGVSNVDPRVIVVQPSLTSENSSKETFPGERVKRPITGSESNASLTPSSAVEETTCDDDLEKIELGHEEETASSTLPEPRGSVSPEVPGRRSHFQLLEFLKIRLDMAANNMEINRLLANVDRALDRTSRTRELGFRRMREAKESLRAAQGMRKAEESRRAAQNIQEETSIDGEEAEDTPPPPIPRICWQ